MVALRAHACFGAFRPVAKDYVLRWAAVAFTGLAVGFGLRRLGVSVALETLRLKILFSALLLAFATVYGATGKLSPRAATRSAVVSDFLLSVVQLLAMITVLLPVTYMAALPRLPLADGELKRLDSLLFGFDWDAATRWVAGHPSLIGLMEAAYSSGYFQIGVILFLGSCVRPGERNSEFLWQFFIAVLLTSAIFVFTPALGKEGHLTYMATLTALRSGQWTVLDYAHPQGIISFPSFHTACAVLFVYAVRRHPWVLSLFVPVNVLMIAATLPIGGHYLIDLFGGAGVAAAAIFATGLLRRHLLHIPMP